MEISHSAAYAAAGVDITAGYKGVKLMSADVKRTHIPGVVSDIGGFGGLFAPDLTGMTEPVLVSGTDGVGTKLQSGLAAGQARHRGHRLRGHVRQRRDLLRREAPVFPGLHRHAARTCRKRWQPLSPAWQRAASRPAAPSSAARPPSMPGIMAAG